MNDKTNRTGRRNAKKVTRMPERTEKKRPAPGKPHAKVIRMPPTTASWSAEEAIRQEAIRNDLFPWMAEIAAHQERGEGPLDEKTEAWLANFPEGFQAAHRRMSWSRKYDQIHPMGQDVEPEFASSVTFGTGGNGWKAFATVNAGEKDLHGFMRFSVNLVEADSKLGRVMEEGHYGLRVVLQVEHDGTKSSGDLARTLLTDPRFGRLFQVHRIPDAPESPTSFELVSKLLATCPLHLECMAQFVERAGARYAFKAKATTHDLAVFRPGAECPQCLECRCECKCPSQGSK